MTSSCSRNGLHYGAALVFLLAALLTRPALAVTYVFDDVFDGDVVAVTLTLTDVAPEQVEIHVSVAPGDGDILGVFGNVPGDDVVPTLVVEDVSGDLTQWQFKANGVSKVGGGNTMAPTKTWDWGVRLGENGSPGGVVVESATFRLSGDGLSAAALAASVTEGLVFGVRIQSTPGPEFSAKVHMLAGTAPVEEPPTIAIATPADGVLLAASPVTISGTTSDANAAVDVNGSSATNTDGSWTTTLDLADGPHTLTATATNGAGSGSDQIAVTVDTTPPVVVIGDPPDGFATVAAAVDVSGSVTDASPIATFTLDGVEVPLQGGAWSASVALAPGTQVITAVAVDQAGHQGSASIGVTRGSAPTISLSTPAPGLLTNQAVISVAGTATGSSPLTVDVNGVAASLSGGSFTAQVPLSEGANLLTATVSNAFGIASAQLSVTRDSLPPVVSIVSPVDGATVQTSPVLVSGSVSDASPIIALAVQGSPEAPGNAFSASVPLGPGANTLGVSATDAAGNVGSATVAVTLAGTALDVHITGPAPGAVVVVPSTTVVGTVSDEKARVYVNGVLATVVGGRFTAIAVPLEPGPNTLTAVATRSGDTATDAVAVVHHPAPHVQISSPRSGAVLRSALTDVDGTVDPPAAFVDVNGTTAGVGPTGRFVVHDLPLASGPNTIIARAIDPYGAQAHDAVDVTRDDDAPPGLQVVSLYGVPYVDDATAFADVDQYDRAQAYGDPAGFFGAPFDPVSRSRMVPTPAVPPVSEGAEISVISDRPDDVQLEYFYEDSTIPALTLVETPTPLDGPGFDPDSYAVSDAFAPAAFVPTHIADFFELPLCAGDSGCPPGGLLQHAVVRARATAGGTSDELALQTDPNNSLQVEITSPAYASNVFGTQVTVTGTVRATMPVLDTARYQVLDTFGTLLDSGTLAVNAEEDPSDPDFGVQGHFTISDLAIGADILRFRVTVQDSRGRSRTTESYITASATAPPPRLVSPADGSAIVGTTVSVSLDFPEDATLTSLNGAPDGRSFAAGYAQDALVLPITPGANLFVLDFDTPSGANTISFTFFGVAARQLPRIQSPAAGAYLNSNTVLVTGAVPLGTPYVEVNGVGAALAADGVTFSATIPVPASTGYQVENGVVVPKPFQITAVAYPLGDATTIDTYPDRVAEPLVELLPPDGTRTLDPEVIVSGEVAEPMLVALETPAQILRVDARTNPRFEFPAVPLAPGVNAFTLRASDRAGNEIVRSLAIEQLPSALALLSPAPGTSVPGLAVDLQLEAYADVTLDALFVGGTLVSGTAWPGGQLPIATGTVTLANVPLQPGTNALRLVYHRGDGTSEVLALEIDSTATAAAGLKGLVTDAATGLPVAGALVTLQIGGQTLVVTTDANGHYRFDVAPGTAVGSVAAAGFGGATFSASLEVGQVAVADLPLEANQLPGVLPPGPEPPVVANEIRILVPPDGTRTDWDAVTVVGEVAQPASSVVVNGIAAQVVGNRFTAPGVVLASGANTLTATAVLTGAADVSDDVQVEQAPDPVLAVTLFSPPDGVSVPGSGLVARGFVSARDAYTQVAGSLTVPVEGVFAVPDLPLAAGENLLVAASRTRDQTQSAFAEVTVSAATDAPALRLSARPDAGIAPLDVQLILSAPGGLAATRIDFDLDGDLVPEVVDDADGVVNATFTLPARQVARALVTTAEGAELSARTRVRAFLAPQARAPFAAGNPVDLAPAPGGDLWVLDGAGARVQRFDRDGALLGSFGSSGGGPQQLSGPQALAVAPDGSIYVADTGNDRIQVFASDGTWLATIGTSGNGPEQLSGPRGVAVDDDFVYVADTGNDRIQVFTRGGTAHARVSFSEPRGLAARAGEGLLVTSPSAGLREFVVRASGQGSLALPRGLAVSGDLTRIRGPVDVAPFEGGVIVADASANAVLEVSAGWTLQRAASEGIALHPLAVQAGFRREIPSIYVADGVEVVEIDLPVQSPVPVVQSLKDRLMAEDIDGALELIHPLQRRLFAQIYSDLGPNLQLDAAAMGSLNIDLLGEDRAIVRIEAMEQTPAGPKLRRFPVTLIRAEDGTWQIYDY